MLNEKVAQTLVVVQVSGSRHTTRQDEKISIVKLAFTKNLVGLNDYVMCSLDKFTASDTYCAYFYACSAQYIYRCQGFNFLEAIGKKFINFGHSIIYISIISIVKITNYKFKSFIIL